MFRNGRRHGFGTEVTTEGEIHMGQYRTGMRHGSGIVFIQQKDGSSIEALGLWNNGKVR